MRFPALIFNPIVRVSTIRTLLSVTLWVITTCVWELSTGSLTTGRDIRLFRMLLGLVCLIAVHHIAVLFANQKLLAIIDLFLNILEIIYTIIMMLMDLSLGILLFLVLLTATAIFRIATLRASPDRFWRQKFAFLGCCSPTNPPYTPWSILLNRSLRRPLVRGEFVGIIILRAVILSGIFLVIPVVALYLIIGAPLQASIQTLTFTDRLGQPLPDIDDSVYAQKNATIAITGGNDFAVNVTVFATVLSEDSSDNVAIACPSVVASDEWAPRGCVQCPIATCPVSWNQTISITASFTFSPQNAPPLIYIMPGQGDVSDLLAFTDPIPIPLGSQLLAVMTWTSREIIPSVSSLLLAPFNSLRLVQHMELYTLLNANYLEKPTPFLSTVVIVQRQTEPTKWVQESAATPLDGISTVGGLWTFVEGVFVLFFGANVVYFAFGRRPLTALGILHFFQSHSLLKKWHEDFPNLYDEGGHPGDTSAGVVAFIRERLVDFNTVEVQDKKDVISDDIEAQNSMQDNSVCQEVQLNCVPHMPRDLERDILLNPADCESLNALSGPNKSQEYLIRAGYQLDDLPLTN
ncbi:hypothetical protein B0H14DRAFT_3167863 [Mycena olivaceomarginata]|nr:hypothetical protein B0H14DRAFT_3167863 [Mycena olivaceomarginata]